MELSELTALAKELLDSDYADTELEQDELNELLEEFGY